MNQDTFALSIYNYCEDDECLRNLSFLFARIRVHESKFTIYFVYGNEATNAVLLNIIQTDSIDASLNIHDLVHVHT